VVTALRHSETVRVLGRRFDVVVTGPFPPGRFEGRAWEGRRLPWRRPYLRAPIRGRTVEDVLERLLHVLHNYVGIDQFRLAVEAVARACAPGARVAIREDARNVIVTLDGDFALETPLIVAREDVLDAGANLAPLRARADAHLRAHARRRA
jgi:hypothetical protein